MHDEHGAFDEFEQLIGARGVVANGEDYDNAVLALSARQAGYTGPIVALVRSPERRSPLQRVGATAVAMLLERN